MKIGIISNLYPPYVRGGAEIVVVRTVEELMNQHHDVFVISSQPRNRGRHVLMNENAVERIYRFFPQNLYYVLNDYKFPWPIRLIWHIVDALCPCGSGKVDVILRDEYPEVVMTHNLKGIGLRIVGAVRASHATHVHIVHDLQLIYPSGLLFAGREQSNRLIRPFYAAYRAVCRWIFKSPDLVIFPSRYLAQEYQRHGFFPDSHVEVLPNPAPSFSAIERSNRNAGRLKLFFVGQLGDHKGLTFMLDTIEAMDIDVQLIIAGEGPLKEQVEQRAANNKRITYLGYATLDQLVNCFGFVDALVVPSLCYENSPTVIYEALQAGVPVLASDIGGVGELVENGRNGYLFQPGSAKDFERAVREMDKNKNEFFSQQEDIRSTVAAHSLPIYVDRLLTLTQEVLDGKGRRSSDDTQTP